MRSMLAAILMIVVTPAVATECRYFTLDNSISFTPNEEDQVLTIHWLDGAQEDCDLSPTGEFGHFVVTCDSWNDYLTYETDPGIGAKFMGRSWRQECFEHA